MQPCAVLLIGTLDTKGTEILFVRDLLRAAGLSVTVLDAGVQPHGHPADVTAEEVFRAAGARLDVLRRAGDRGAAVTAAAKGAAACRGTAPPRCDCGRFGSRRLGGHDHRHRGHARAAVRRTEGDGQHSRQWTGPALRRRPRHLHAELRCRRQRPESHQPHRFHERRQRVDRHGSCPGSTVRCSWSSVL